MKKASIVLFVLFFAVVANSFAQSSAPTDFFAGKWEYTVKGTPNGDAKFVTNLMRKDGKLTGELVDPTDATKPKIAITNIEESSDKIVIYFTAQGYDLNLDLSKVDNDNLKGTLFNMFESKGVRIKEMAAPADFYAGKWEISIMGTPNGDSKLTTELIRKDGKLTGELKDPSGKMDSAIPIETIIEEKGKIILGFTAQGYNISMDLGKVDDDNLKGSIMDGRFDAAAKRIK